MTAPTFVEPTQVRSAYPPPVDDLLPQVREIAGKTGELPSRNEIMKTFRVGAPKANAVRDVLLAEATPGPAAGTELDPSEPVFRLADLTSPLITTDGHPSTLTPPSEVKAVGKPVRSWPILFLAAGAFVAIWSGWVGIGSLTGFGVVHLLPGIWDGFKVNTAISLPIGVEAYAAYALRVWLSGRVPARARRFARASAIGSLGLGCAGQVAYHLMAAAHVTAAPWWITTLVSCFPVAVLGMGAALAHLLREQS